MSQGNQSCLRFSLEESVWFRKGQEVAELVSVSLDPDITIQESEQYVTISGALQLTGEYKRHEDSAVEESLSTLKYVQVVEEREEGVCEFSHQFPVDITIPNNRIQSIYDVDVMVESFDYVFPERSCLKLVAELTISGLYGEQQHEVVEEEMEFEPLFRSYAPEIEVEEMQMEMETANLDSSTNQMETEAANLDDETEEMYTTFEAEARKKAEEQLTPEAVMMPVFNFQPEESSYAPWMTQNNSEDEQLERAEVTVPQSVPNAIPSESKLAEKSVPPMAEAAPKQGSLSEMMMKEESSSSSSESAQPEQKKSKTSKKKGMSLTEFFARKEEEEQPAKLRMCIVQKGDTVETLSERYEVPVPSLLRINHLELNQDVYEGQVLYIPGAYAR